MLEALPGEWSRLQGRNPSCSICDEVHVMDPDTWDALALAGGTRSYSPQQQARILAEANPPLEVTVG